MGKYGPGTFGGSLGYVSCVGQANRLANEAILRHSQTKHKYLE